MDRSGCRAFPRDGADDHRRVFLPYASYIDPKPPLLFFTVSLMDIVSPAG